MSCPQSREGEEGGSPEPPTAKTRKHRLLARSDTWGTVAFPLSEFGRDDFPVAGA